MLDYPLLKLVEDRLRGTSYRWIGGRTLSDGAILVFVVAPSGEVQGIFVDTDDLGSRGQPPDAEVVAEILEPSARYIVPDVDWADGSVADPDAVVWRGIGPDQYPGQARASSPADGSGSDWYIGFERE